MECAYVCVCARLFVCMCSARFIVWVSLLLSSSSLCMVSRIILVFNLNKNISQISSFYRARLSCMSGSRTVKSRVISRRRMEANVRIYKEFLEDKYIFGQKLGNYYRSLFLLPWTVPETKQMHTFLMWSVIWVIFYTWFASVHHI